MLVALLLWIFVWLQNPQIDNQPRRIIVVKIHVVVLFFLNSQKQSTDFICHAFHACPTEFANNCHKRNTTLMNFLFGQNAIWMHYFWLIGNCSESASNFFSIVTWYDSQTPLFIWIPLVTPLENKFYMILKWRRSPNITFWHPRKKWERRWVGGDPGTLIFLHNQYGSLHALQNYSQR